LRDVPPLTNASAAISKTPHERNRMTVESRQSSVDGKTILAVDFFDDAPDELVVRWLRIRFTDGTAMRVEASYYDGPCLVTEREDRVR
jgi:hypothetical protein